VIGVAVCQLKVLKPTKVLYIILVQGVLWDKILHIDQG